MSECHLSPMFCVEVKHAVYTLVKLNKITMQRKFVIIFLLTQAHFVSRLFTIAASLLTVCGEFLNATTITFGMWIDGFGIDKSWKMRLFPFKKVTVPEDPAGKRPAADRSGGIPKNFSNTQPRSLPRVFPVVSGPSTDVEPRRLCPVSVSGEADAVRRARKKKSLKRKNLCSDARATASLPPSKLQLRWLTLASAISWTKSSNEHRLSSEKTWSSGPAHVAGKDVEFLGLVTN